MINFLYETIQKEAVTDATSAVDMRVAGFVSLLKVGIAPLGPILDDGAIVAAGVVLVARIVLIDDLSWHSVAIMAVTIVVAIVVVLASRIASRRTIVVAVIATTARKIRALVLTVVSIPLVVVVTTAALRVEARLLLRLIAKDRL